MHCKDIGYKLTAAHEVETIACTDDNVKEKYFAMLKTWLETDRNPCYCKLFATLEVYKYYNMLKNVKEIINP